MDVVWREKLSRTQVITRTDESYNINNFLFSHDAQYYYCHLTLTEIFCWQHQERNSRRLSFNFWDMDMDAELTGNDIICFPSLFLLL